MLGLLILSSVKRWAFQVALVVKNLPANAGDVRDVGLIPGSGRSPGEGHDNPLQYSYLENPWTKEPGGLQFMGFARVGHSLVTKPSSSHEFILYILTDMAFKELHRHSKIKSIKN